MQAMLLAAGLGTRLRPYTDICPKPLFPVLNRPLLHTLLDMLHAAGCARTVVNGHHLSRLIREAVKKYPDVVFQDELEILGTGGGIRQALDRFDREPILVMNGDIVHSIDLARLYRQHTQSGNIVTLAVHDYPRFNSITCRDDRILSFHSLEKARENSLLAFTGIHVVEPEVIRQIPAGRFHHIIDLYEELVSRGEKVGLVRVDDSFWRDIGTPEDYLQLHGELLTGNHGQYRFLPSVHEQWLIDRRARIAEDVNFSGWGCIGQYAEIGPGTVLENCVIWDQASIPGRATLKNRIIPGPTCLTFDRR